MTNTKLALVGPGVIGKRHIAAIQSVDAARLAAIVDVDPAGKAVADAHGAEWFSDIDAMLKTIEPDGVIVATPTEHHLAPCVAALHSGAHVLVEKPITATLAEAQKLIDLSARTERHVLVGHHRRYYPLVHKARELLRGGTLGDLVAVSGQWNVRKHTEYFEPDWRRKWQAGPVLTNLIHEIDLLRYLCGEIVSLSAELSYEVMHADKEDAVAMILRFANGALGTFILSDQTPSPWGWEAATGENVAFPKSAQNAYRFMGTQACLDFPNLTLWRYPDGSGSWHDAMQPETVDMALGDAYVAQCAHFCSVIHGSETPRITAADATKTLRATLATYDAAQSGKRVSLSSQ